MSTTRSVTADFTNYALRKGTTADATAKTFDQCLARYVKKNGLTVQEAIGELLMTGVNRQKALDEYNASPKGKAAQKKKRTTASKPKKTAKAKAKPAKKTKTAKPKKTAAPRKSKTNGAGGNAPT